jgi:hypothetical protein
MKITHFMLYTVGCVCAAILLVAFVGVYIYSHREGTTYKLPLYIQVVDSETHKPISGAIVELQWACGFQGYYWGKPIVTHTDISGKVIFSSDNVLPISSDGYSLGRRITKLFIATLIVSADGYEDVALSAPKDVQLVSLVRKNYKVPAGVSP